MSCSSGMSSNPPFPHQYMARLASTTGHGASPANVAPPPRKMHQQRQTTNQQKKPLTIIPYNPDPANRKATRRNQTSNGSSGGGHAPSESEASSGESAVAKPAGPTYPYPPPIERVPTSRSWDPFNALAVLYISKEERFIMNYAYTTSWAVWGDTATGKNRFAESWMLRAMESSAAFYAQLVGAASHYYISQRDSPTMSPRIAAVRLQAKAKAIENLQKEISLHRSSAASISLESLFNAIFALAVHDNIDLASPSQDHPLSHLAKVRDMQIYGRVVFGSEHMNAMYQLLDQMGGLANLNPHAFGDIVPLLDMLYGFRTQTRPKLPCYRSLKPLRVPAVWQPDERAEELLAIAASSFLDDDSGPPAVRLDDNFRRLLGVLGELSAALDHCQRLGLSVFKDPHVVLENCDWVSHGLLSLYPYLPEHDFSESVIETEGYEDVMMDADTIGVDAGEADEADPISHTPDSILSEICRLVALLFIDMVIYPTPPQAGVKNKLSKMLFPLLQSTVADTSLLTEYPAPLADLVVWGALMGAISARCTELQDEYIAFVADNCLDRLSSWGDIEPRLQSFVWLNDVFDEPAQKIWQQAKKLADSTSGEQLSVL